MDSILAAVLATSRTADETDDFSNINGSVARLGGPATEHSQQEPEEPEFRTNSRRPAHLGHADAADRRMTVNPISIANP